MIQKIIIGYVALSAISTAFSAETIKAVVPPQKVLSSENGRFAYGQVSDFRKDQFMLDTKTGRMWHVVYATYKNSKGEDVPGEGYPVLEPVVYEDINGNRSVEPKEK